MDTIRVSVATAKKDFSACVARSAHANCRLLITRRNRPVAALVSLADLQVLEQQQKREGLAAVRSKWTDFDELSPLLDEVVTQRQKGGSGRHVSL